MKPDVAPARRQDRARRGKAGTGAPAVVVAFVLLLVAGVAALVVAVSRPRPGEQSIPADPKARSEFVETQGSRMSEEERRLLKRFVTRVQAQEAAGNPAPTITVARAIEQQRTYDQEVAQVQKRIQEGLDAAKAALDVSVRAQSLVGSDAGEVASVTSLRYVIEVTNPGPRTIESLALRAEFRDPSQEHVAAAPTLEVKGPLLAGETLRSVQILPLNAKYHQYIMGGGEVRVSAYPTRVTFLDAEKVDVEKELKLLESMSRARIE